MTTAATDITTIKLGRQFDALDSNNDGHIDWSDYQQLVDRFISTFRLGKNDPRAGGIQAFYQMYWQELLRHATPGKQRLTKDEYLDALRLAMIDTSRLNIVEGAGHAVFDCMDTDGNNEISMEEFENLLRKVWEINAPDAIGTFHRLDLDGDGSVSRQEFLRATREYYYSTDPDAAGSMMFGSV